MNSQDTPIIQAVRDFISGCPCLREYDALMVDRLEDGVSSYSIEPVPCTPIVKRYVNGSSLRQYEFHFASREAFTQEVLDEISNSAFYERFAAWLEECSRMGNLPLLDGNRLATDIEALTNGYLADADAVKGRYVIQCRLYYMQAA